MRFHGLKPPRHRGQPEIAAFLSYLATQRKVKDVDFARHVIIVRALKVNPRAALIFCYLIYSYSSLSDGG